MEQEGRLKEPGSVEHSEHFELTFVSGTQRAPSGVLYNVREIDRDVMRVFWLSSSMTQMLISY